ncbi:MAG: cupin domain-containing protein, partial [Arcobacter sp.]|nr:cupin domain-containing protein [Arcobacter sp.]
IIDEAGRYLKVKIGKNIAEGEVYQTVIQKNNWFAAEVVDKKSFALVGCTVSPGFDFSDFEFAERNVLTEKFPEEIKKYKAKTAAFIIKNLFKLILIISGNNVK